MENKKIALLLDEFFMQFNYQHNYLFCLKCGIALFGNFERHARQYHSVKIFSSKVNQVRLFLESNLSKLEELHFKNSVKDLEPLEGIKTFSGLKCISCFYCCVSSETMRKHKCSSKIVVSKQVQSFNYKKNLFYFSVILRTTS